MLLVKLVSLEFLARMVSLVHLVKEEPLVSMVPRELLEYLVLLDHLAQLENPDRLESPVFLALPVFLGNLAGLVNQEKKGPQDLLVLKADLAYQDHLVCQDFLEKEVYLDFQECLA